ILITTTTMTTTTTTTTHLSLESVDSVLAPVGGSGRVKYTCLDVSRRYLVLGANTGSIYFFERKMVQSQQHQHQQQSIMPMLLNNDGVVFNQILSFNDIRDSITSIKINPTNDNLVAIATQKVIFVIEPNLTIRKEKEKILFKMTDHPRDTETTCIVWSPCGNYLLSGDDGGNVFCCSIPKARRAFFFSAEPVCKLDSRVVQLDTILIAREGAPQQPTQTTTAAAAVSQTSTLSILASSLTKTSIINYQIGSNVSGKLLTTVQVGKKLREKPTKQGACFHPLSTTSVYASRPGKRLWLADSVEGTVLSTMNFKSGGEEGAVVVTPMPLSSDLSSPMLPPGVMSFARLLPYGAFVVSFDEKTLLLIDVNEVEVLEWRVDSTLLQDLCVSDDAIYILHGPNRTMSRVYHASTQQQHQQQQQQHQQQIAFTVPTSVPVPVPILSSTVAQQTAMESSPSSGIVSKPATQPSEITLTDDTKMITTTTDVATLVDTQKPPSSTNGTTTNQPIVVVENGHIDEPKNEIASELSKDTPYTLTEENSADTISLTNSTSSMTLEDVIDQPQQPNDTAATAVTPTAPQPSTNFGHTRTISKENIFAQIEVSNNPLVIATTSTTRKKKKKPEGLPVNPLKTSGADVPNTTTAGSSMLSSSQDQSLNSSSSSITTEDAGKGEPTLELKNSTGVKRTTVIIKKKVIKKSTANSSSSNIVTPTSTPTMSDKPPSPTKPEQHPVTDTTSTANQPNQQQQTPPLSSSNSTTTAPTPSPPSQLAGLKTSGIFKGISAATNSIQEIRQLAVNKIQKVDLKSEFSTISQKIQSNFGSVTSTPTTSTPPTLEQHVDPLALEPTQPASVENVQPVAQPPPPPELTPVELLDKLTRSTYDAMLAYHSKKIEAGVLPLLQPWLQAFNRVEYVAPSEMVSEIITGCFLLGVNPMSYDSQGRLCRCWNETSARETIRKYFTYLDCNKIYPYVNERQWDSCTDTLLDMETFARQNSKVIATLNTFIDSNDGTGCIQYLENHLDDIGLLFRYMEILLDSQTKLSTLFYASRYPVILPRNILKFVDQRPAARLAVKFEYLNHLMIKTPECRMDTNLMEDWFLSNLVHLQPPKDQLFITNDNIPETRRPRVGAHLIEWKHSVQLMSIINKVVSNEYIFNISRLEHLCEQHGFFEGLLAIYSHLYRTFGAKSHSYNEELRNQYVQKLLNLVVATDNIDALTKVMENNIDLALWTTLLEKMQEQRDYYNNIFFNRDTAFAISEPFAARLMGRSIGALQAIDLLLTSSLFESAQLPSELFSEWIRNGKWTMYNRKSIAHEILSRLDSYLWTKKPMNLSPQIWSLVVDDLNHFHTPTGLKAHHQTLQQQQQQQHQQQDLISSTEFFEDSSFHWGTETELHGGQCPVCTLPLIENPESSFLGVTPSSVIVFPYCGHSYHQCCIEEQGCLLCYSQR
ncbi:hypothetical protein SAMD00019534_058600, partial [Acytostelium subglobosum LB1]|uniref:hypothetical protein n=1 Tax=Acytostelium subglobosum LB1 TaxID=1410327 RepID=UPI0006449658